MSEPRLTTHPDQTSEHGIPEGLGDLPIPVFREAMHRVADLTADYLEGVGEYPVLPAIRPGELKRALPSAPPVNAETIGSILDDYEKLIEPNMTHWNHPGFMAYFAVSGSAPGILGEALCAALNVNAMLWRTGPAPTELEEVACDWVRQMLGLPEEFVGHINDTASISTLLALAAARHRPADLQIRQRGMSGRPDLPPLMVYASEQAHSSVDKAMIALGLGLDNLRHIGVDKDFRMDVDALERALAEDKTAGRRPLAIVATGGTTSTTAVDPIAEIAEICRREGIWLHVDAAYAGSAAVCPEYRSLLHGWELGDSIVMNPHKWLFTPVDCSLLFVRDPAVLRGAFSLTPEYLKTPEQGVTNLMDWGIQLGRRFRSLKLWMVVRSFGVSGIQARIRAHCAYARAFADWVAADPAFEICAPVPFSTVCFRAIGAPSPEAQDRLNERLLADVNSQGPVFLSHTKLRDRIVLRLTIGNIRTTPQHVETAWRLLRDGAQRLSAQA